MVITEVITVFGHNNMQRNEMAPFQKKKEIIRYIAAESLEFDQENSLITVITLFFPLLLIKKSFTPNSCNTVFLTLYNCSSGQQLLHMAAILPMGFKFCFGKHFNLISPRIQENTKSTSLLTGTILESFIPKYHLVT